MVLNILKREAKDAGADTAERNCRPGSKRKDLVPIPKLLRLLIALGLVSSLQLCFDFTRDDIPMSVLDTADSFVPTYPALNLNDGNNEVEIASSTAKVDAAGRDTTALCVLTKDDGEILNEWIAYHYHVLNARHLILAVDPLSETSPEPLLRKWEDLFGMNIEIWHDEDYMPEFFLKGKYNEVNFFNITLPSGLDEDQVTIVNNHVFRQRTFASHCLLSIKQRRNDPHENGKWVVLVDSDEYISLNPKFMENIGGMEPSAGSLLNYLNDFFRVGITSLSRGCLLMPRLLYLPKSHNSKKKQEVINTSIWNTDRFETLRWEVHRDLAETNAFGKAILDVAGISENHTIFNISRIRSIHNPLGQDGPTGCEKLGATPDLNDLSRYPLVVNHYFGSLERYLGRTDSRRDESIWRKKVALNGTLGDGWILGWLPSFVEEHGLEKVSQVLQEYRHIQ
eukprot:scaffold4973_cov135-Cylindrotheca_fusiformis.AAC.10